MIALFNKVRLWVVGALTAILLSRVWLWNHDRKLKKETSEEVKADVNRQDQIQADSIRSAVRDARSGNVHSERTIIYRD